MNILVSRRGALGDVLRVTPIIRRLRKENPDADIFVDTLHPEAFLNSPDRVLLHRGIPRRNYDLEIDLNGAYEKDRKRNQIDAYFSAAFRDLEGDKSIILSPDPNFSLGGVVGPYVVLHPNISWPSRTFSVTWWNEVALLISDRFPVMVTGTEQDHHLSGERIYSLRNQLPLAAQVSLIANSACFVGGDSGVVAVAGATEVPMVVMCTITRAEYFMPYRRGSLEWNTHPIPTSLPCYGCSELQPPAEYYECLRGDNACVKINPPDPSEVANTVFAAIAADLRRLG